MLDELFFSIYFRHGLSIIETVVLDHNKKYTFRFGSKKIVFSKSPHETDFHVYARALLYGLFHKRYPTIRVEARVDERFQPDLSAEDYDGTMLFWAEVGNVSINKIEKLFKKYRRAHFVFIKEERDLATFQKHLERMTKGMRSLPLVDIVVYPPQFQEWWVSEEGDVFISKDDITVIHWNDPGDRKKFF